MQPRRFHGSVSLQATPVGRDAGRIADEVISHLAGLVGSDLNVTLEISAEVQGGVPDKVVWTVTENCRALKFKDHGFEESRSRCGLGTRLDLLVHDNIATELNSECILADLGPRRGQRNS